MQYGDEMRIRQRMIQTVKALRSDLRTPPWQPPGHYYSPVPSTADVTRAIHGRRLPISIELNAEGQCELATKLALTCPQDHRWVSKNGMFGSADASILRSMLLHFQPRRIVEVGSGYSTALMLDVAEDHLPGLHINCVEPYPQRLQSLLRPGDLHRIELYEKPVQSIEPIELVARVDSGDILFIDSSHVVKAGSDVGYLLLHTLPLLPVGAVVHVHDIFWPFEYLDEWLYEGRAWNEAYLLHAFLSHNDSWKILLFGSWLWEQHRELATPGTELEKPGSIWLQRVK